MDLIQRALVAHLILSSPCDALGHPLYIRRKSRDLSSCLCVSQFIRPTVFTTSFCGLITHYDISTIGRETGTAHPFAIEQIVGHIGMRLVECISHSLVCLDHDTDRVCVLRLCQILNGKGVVLWGEFQLWRCLLTIQEELVVLGAFDLDLAFDEVAVVYIEGQQTHALAVWKRW